VSLIPRTASITPSRVKTWQIITVNTSTVNRIFQILWNNQQLRQCAVKFISLQVHSTCFGRHTRPSSGVQF